MGPMKDLLESYGNFVLRAFDFQGRSTPIEYWAVLPLIWGFILYALMADITAVWTLLLARQIPTLNPLAYTSFLIFILTFIPRLSLSIRRWHDTSRTLIWLFFPTLVLISALVLLSALTGSMMNSSLTGVSDGPDELSNILYPIMLLIAAPTVFWQEMYTISQAFYSLGNDAVWVLLAEIYAHGSMIDVRRDIANVTTEIEGNFGHAFGLIAVSVGLILTPILAVLVHMLMMVLPSSPFNN
jgi:uncharacterized membrane protein YhaH (DUF805 family)